MKVHTGTPDTSGFREVKWEQKYKALIVPAAGVVPVLQSASLYFAARHATGFVKQAQVALWGHVSRRAPRIK